MMKNIMALLLTGGLFSSGCAAPQVILKHRPDERKQIRVAVLPFKDAQNAPGSGEAAAEAMTTYLLKIPAYEMIERSAMEKILQEQKLGVTGAIDPETVANIGKILGVDALVIGAVTQYQKRKLMVLPPAKITLAVRMVRTQTGSLDWTATYSAGWHPLKWFAFFPPPGVILGPLAILTSPSAEDCIQKAARKITEEIALQIRGPKNR